MRQRFIRLVEGELLDHAVDPVHLGEFNGFFCVLRVSRWPGCDRKTVVNHGACADLSWLASSQNDEFSHGSKTIQERGDLFSDWSGENDC
jgi:hypothetical protein